MNLNLCSMTPVAVAISVLFSACGGGGDSPAPAAPESTASAPVVKVADVTFVNVEGDRYKESVIQGEREVTLASFQIQHKPALIARATQLFFKNTAADYKPGVLENLRIVDAYGSDVKWWAPYKVSVDSNGKVKVDFDQNWDVGAIRSGDIYWLKGNVTVGAEEKAQFAFSLSEVRMHEEDLAVVSEVKGRQMTVSKIAGVDLPTVTSSQAKFDVPLPSIGYWIDMVEITPACPAGENQPDCIFKTMQFSVHGAYDDVYLYVDGEYYATADHAGWDPVTNSDQYAIYFYWDGGLKIPSGKSRKIAFRAGAIDLAVTFTVGDMMFTLGDETNATQVSPVIPTGKENCGKAVHDKSYCPG